MTPLLEGETLVSTLCLLQELIPPADWIDVTGDVPEAPELPEDAIP